jgi:hypothetical protein
MPDMSRQLENKVSKPVPNNSGVAFDSIYTRKALRRQGKS